jgi:hypothetical protein
MCAPAVIAGQHESRRLTACIITLSPFLSCTGFLQSCLHSLQLQRPLLRHPADDTGCALRKRLQVLWFCKKSTLSSWPAMH